MKRLIMLLIAVLPWPALAASDPQIAFDGRFVRVAKNPPRAEIVLFAVGLVPTGFESVTYHRLGTITADDSGIATYDAGIVVPCKSVWVAANVTSGAFTVAGPCPVHTDKFNPGNLRRGAGSEIDSLVSHTPFVDILYVEPGGGTYVFSAEDGRSTDQDARNDGYTTTSLANATLLTGHDTPRRFTPGGVLIVIDSYAMKVATVRLDATMLKGLP